MATFKATISKHHKKADGTYNVKIRVTHKRTIKYLATQFYVTQEDITKGLKIKNQLILDGLEDIVKKYRGVCNALGERLGAIEATELLEYLKDCHKGKESFKLDFIKFGREKVQEMLEIGRKGSAATHNNVLNSLEKFIGANTLDINEINVFFLKRYASWLGERLQKKGSSAEHHYLSLIRSLHNIAKNEYNDEDIGVINIPLSPFKKFKIPKPPVVKKRAVATEKIRAIYQAPYVEPSKTGVSRYNLAKDVFILSFALAGMNAIDLYTCAPIQNGRLTYNRTKTKTRRSDRAEISIKIEPEILPLIEKYKDPEGHRAFKFYKMFKTSGIFNESLNVGLKKLGALESVGIDNLQFYAARHSWATIAMNKARVDKYTVHAALNHSDPNMAITDVYIEKDYSLIDEANRKVLDYVKLEIPEIVDVLQEK